MPPSPAAIPSTRTHPWISHSSPTCRRKLRNLRRHPTLNQTLKIPQVLQVFLLLHVLRSRLACPNARGGLWPRRLSEQSHGSIGYRDTSPIKLILRLSLHTCVYVPPHTSVYTYVYIRIHIWYLYMHVCHVHINICMCTSYMYTNIQRERPIKRPLHVGPPLATQKESCPDPLASFGLFTRSSLRALCATSKTVCIFEPQIVTSLPSWG